MAGPSIGTWVKVRSKSGGTTPRVLAKKYGGGAYQQGQVITQSEYESYKKQRAEGMKAEEASPQRTGRSNPTANAKGQGMLFDARQYISPKALQREQRRVAGQISDLRAQRSIAKDGLIEGGSVETVARQQARIARINQQIAKLKEINSGKRLSPRLAKGTTEEGKSAPNRDRSSLNSRIKRLSRRSVTTSFGQYVRF
jgi:hypothetical protein